MTDKEVFERAYRLAVRCSNCKAPEEEACCYTYEPLRAKGIEAGLAAVSPATFTVAQLAKMLAELNHKGGKAIHAVNNFADFFHRQGCASRPNEDNTVFVKRMLDEQVRRYTILERDFGTKLAYLPSLVRAARLALQFAKQQGHGDLYDFVDLQQLLNQFKDVM